MSIRFRTDFQPFYYEWIYLLYLIYRTDVSVLGWKIYQMCIMYIYIYICVCVCIYVYRLIYTKYYRIYTLRITLLITYRHQETVGESRHKDSAERQPLQPPQHNRWHHRHLQDAQTVADTTSVV